MINPKIFSHLSNLYRDLGEDQRNKMQICEAFYKLLTYSGSEFVKALQSILYLLLSFISDEDEQIIYKAKEIDEILKAKFTYYFEKETDE